MDKTDLKIIKKLLEDKKVTIKLFKDNELLSKSVAFNMGIDVALETVDTYIKGEIDKDYIKYLMEGLDA